MGSGGGGSSTSTTYTYPEWVRRYYERANDAVWKDAEAAKASNPYQFGPVSPADLIAALTNVTRWLDNELFLFDPELVFNNILTGPDSISNTIFGLLDHPTLKAALTGQANQLVRTTEEQILPKFRRGMQTIGAVNTSAFKIGEALIWSGQIEKMTDHYYDKLGGVAFSKVLDSADRLADMHFKKLALLQTFTELQIKCSEGIYKLQNEFNTAQNEFRASQLMWPLEIDKILISAAGSWQSTPASSSTSSKQQSDPFTSILGGVLGIGGMVAGIMGMSDRNLKTDIEPVEDILDKLMQLDIYEYTYRPEYSQLPAGRHIGPMAQDWAKLFGGNGRVIYYQDMFGVLLEATKEIAKRLKELEKKS